MLQTTDEQIFRAALREPERARHSGIFLSFWLHVPPTTQRKNALAVHIAVHRHKTGVVGTLIPINYYPLPGTSPPWVPDLVMPHAVATYIARKLERLGITEHVGFISERHVTRGTLLTRQANVS